MRVSYRSTILIFAALYLVPVVLLGWFVARRIEQRQITLQFFLQNQVDIDRKILDQRTRLRSIASRMRQVFLAKSDPREVREFVSFLAEEQKAMNEFWQKYESTYSANQRPFLQSVLRESQEEGLIDEEAELVRNIRRSTDAYIAGIRAYPPLSTSVAAEPIEYLRFLAAADEERQAVFGPINGLSDVRYIFAQRVVFLVSGENDRQRGFFTAVFIALFAALLITVLLEYFSVHKPFRDIMRFLRDLSEGKRGQRLYFSSPVNEIKESEEIINRFVGAAEAHEAHERKPS